MSCKMTNVTARSPLALAAALLALGASAGTTGLPRPMAEQAAAAGIPAESIGVVVRRAGAAEPVLAVREREPFQPASTLKLLTAIVALDTFGPDHRGRTELRASGRQAGDTWRGDLVLRGLADADFDAAALERMLLVLRARGVRTIAGDVLVDRSFFAPARADLAAPAFDETPEFRYNVVPDALPVAMNLHRLALAADARGVTIAASPDLPGVRFRSAMRVVDGDCNDWEALWQLPETRRAGTQLVVTLRGAFPRGCSAETEVNVIPREEYAARLFTATWRRLGGQLRGRVREAAPAVETQLLAEHRSRPLGEIVRDIAKRSDNPVTRLTWLALGARDAQPGADTALRADAVTRAWLAARGIDAGGLRLENGSGLSRRERISPATLAGVVEAAMASPWWLEFAASLPIAGVDGGLRRRLRDSPATAKARLKTGTLRDAWALAGFVDVEGRGRYVVVAMINDPVARAADARATLDALVGWVAAGMPVD